MTTSRVVNAGARLRRVEARLLEATVVVPTISVLSCIRDYFAGVDAQTVAAKMRRGGVPPDLVRFYSEDVFTTTSEG